MKRCTACGQEKPLSEFYRESRVKDGRTARCKDCGRAYWHQYFHEGQRGPRDRGGWKEKTIPRKPTKHISQLAALLHLAQQHGPVDVTACMKAVRDGVGMRW